MTLDDTPPGDGDYFMGRRMARRYWFTCGSIASVDRTNEIIRKREELRQTDWGRGWVAEMRELVTSATEESESYATFNWSATQEAK